MNTLLTQKTPRILAMIAGLVLVSLALAACSSDDGAADADGGTSTAATDPVDVEVTVSEFSITSSVTEFEQGVPYHFIVKNEGTIAHELMLMPPMAMSGMSMEAMDAMALNFIAEDDLGPGETRTMDYTFDRAYGAGELEFACHITGHYDAGMHLALEVGG